MAKGQKRSNREPKKPKADKKMTRATAGAWGGRRAGQAEAWRGDRRKQEIGE